MIRLGLIGNGKWGANYPKAAFEAGNCTVTDVAGRDWRKLLDRMIDAFIVATPPDARLEICSELLARNRPVMIEKPLALDVDSALAITAGFVGEGLPFLVNHQHLFAPAYETLRDIAGTWDDFEIVSCGEGPGPIRDYSALWDYGPHDVAMVLGLGIGRVVRARRRNGGFEISLVDETSRREALVRVSNAADEKHRVFNVIRDSGETISYNDRAEAKLQRWWFPVPVSPEKPLTRSVRAFAEAVKTGRTDWRFGSFGLEAVRILEEADKQMMEA